MTGLARDLAAAFGLLTRLPVGDWATPDPARAVWAYPLAGAAVGAVGAAGYWAAGRLGLAAPLAALWSFAAMLAATGALHEDGLADTADAFGGGRTRERRLEILRDSRIGTFGALALLVSSALRVASVASLTPAAAWGALIASGALGRAAMLVGLAMLRPARPDGLGAGLRGVAGATVALGLSLGGAVAFLALPFRAALGAAVLAAATGAAVALAARRAIGGHTGDVLGASSVAAECVVLSLLAAHPG